MEQLTHSDRLRRLRYIDMSGACTQPPANSKGAVDVFALKSAGKGPLDAMRKACRERGVELRLSNATSYKI